MFKPQLKGAAALLVVLIACFYAWTAIPEWRPELVSSRNDGYYNLLIRGFLRGHLYLDARPDPFLATLANPWDPVQRAGHGFPDASYYHGRYYIYHGVAPALLLFLPFHLLTGRFLDESLGTVVFAVVGLGISAWLLCALRRRYFPQISGAVAAAGLLALGLADMMPVMLRGPSFREVPIACGYACCMAGFAALFRSLHRARAAAWLATAAVAFGLAVGSRPLYLLACPVVLLPVWLDARERALGGRCWLDPRWRRLALAAVLPLAVIGAGLAAYNYLRFGHLAEFGLRWEFWTEDAAHAQYFAGRYAPFNLRAYWLQPAGWVRYFPFVNVAALPLPPARYYGVEDPFGVIPNMPFILCALGAVLYARRGFPARLRIFCGGVAWAAAAMALPLIFFFAALNRYMVDFVPAAMWLAVLGLFGLAARAAGSRGARRAITVAALALAAFSAGFNVLASVRHDELLHVNDPARFARMAHRWNRLSYWYDRWRHTAYGPLEMTVAFPGAPQAGMVEPLVVTGRTFLSDYLFVRYLGPDSLQFGLEHTSRGTFLGRSVHVAFGPPHTVRVDMGSLYPPAAHPYFDAMSPAEARLRQNTLRVTVDGKVALERELTFYEADGPHPSLGTSAGRPGFSAPFSGRILGTRRLGAAPVTAAAARFGAIRVDLTLPPFGGPRDEPLVSAGEAGQGDLVYLHYERADRIALGFAHPGWGAFLSPLLAVDPAQTQRVEVDLPELHPEAPPSAGTPARGLVDLRLNGRSALRLQGEYAPAASESISVGLNAAQAPVASPLFTGNILEIRREDRLPEPARYGAVRLRVKLPAFSGPQNEPLVCAGRPGRGDLVYLRYEGPGEISFGYDHWSVGGAVSPRCRIDPAAIQEIEIDFGSLHPGPAGDADPVRRLGRPGRLVVRLNGRSVLDEAAPYYPCDPDAIAIASNPIQTSTAGAGFTGELIEAERAPEPAAARP